ncbi:uncharacterized protein LOC132281313 isoform X2 [Cornus florida]|uniref:uncharacterized protein LOC132281313 isoform X2 n=1 Tax=Cornus florida TaxID=4283 RepID=UPI00289954E8|nr:uncharacterized protein LOC132281313 isoform X2 [Cornus florida]
MYQRRQDLVDLYTIEICIPLRENTRHNKKAKSIKGVMTSGAQQSLQQQRIHQEHSNTNTISRFKQKYAHTVGSKSFARIREEEDNVRRGLMKGNQLG